MAIILKFRVYSALIVYRDIEVSYSEFTFLPEEKLPSHSVFSEECH